MLKWSTGIIDAMNGLEAEVIGAVIGAGLTFVDGGAGSDTITDSGNGFITAGFAPGRKIFVQGATTPANDSAITGVRLTGVAAGTLTFATGTVDTGEAGGAGTVVACATGGSLKDLMKDGRILIYSGSQPTDADSAFTGTLLLTLTESSGAFVAGAFGNGLELENDPTDGIIEKSASETWSGVAVATGSAGYFVWLPNSADAGAASTTLYRAMGSIGVGSGDLQVPSLTITSGKTYTYDEFKFTLPHYYGE